MHASKQPLFTAASRRMYTKKCTLNDAGRVRYAANAHTTKAHAQARAAVQSEQQQQQQLELLLRSHGSGSSSCCCCCRSWLEADRCVRRDRMQQQEERKAQCNEKSTVRLHWCVCHSCSAARGDREIEFGVFQRNACS